METLLDTGREPARYAHGRWAFAELRDVYTMRERTLPTSWRETVRGLIDEFEHADGIEVSVESSDRGRHGSPMRDGEISFRHREKRRYRE